MTELPKHGSQPTAAQRLSELLKLPDAEREPGLEALCADHPEQAAEIRALFLAEQEATIGVSVFGRLGHVSKQSSYTEGARVGDLVGDFSLISRIASGGQGEVWVAEQRSLQRRVAFKLVRPDRINEKTLALFAREARAGGRLAHPGIVGVLGYGEDDGRHWIAQELVEGGWTLQDFIEEIRAKAHLPKNYYAEVARFTAELADALHAAHEAGVIHRDVKPQNVLVTKSAHPKLTDFGLARITDEAALSMTGDFVGTWLYMSPEQVTANRVEIDHRTDIFSLGVVMYELLALRRPFDGDTTRQIAENIVFREAPDLQKLRSKIPRDLAIICAKALEKRKDQRFPTAGAFAADIRRHMASEPIQARPPGLLDRAQKWVRRHPTKSLAMILASAAFVTISWLSLNLAESNDELALKTLEAEQSSIAARASAALAVAEAKQAEQRTEDVLRLSLSQDLEDLTLQAAQLWPPLPVRIPELSQWVARASKLTAELPALRHKRDELRLLALPQSAAERQADQETHPQAAAFHALQAQWQARSAALLVRRGEQTPTEVSPNWKDQPSSAGELNNLAWERIQPDRETFGQEGLGLALALRASELAQPQELWGILDSVAWGQLALGQDELAIEASEESLDAAPADQAQAAQENLKQLKNAARQARSPAGMAREEQALLGLAKRCEGLELQIEERRSWRFPREENAGPRAHWWHNQLSGLILKLEALSHPENGMLSPTAVSLEHGWSVAKRLQYAQELELALSPGGEHQRRWERDLPAIHSAYPGLQLSPQVGLVPVGQDPLSKLWEFWDVQSGTEPLRAGDGSFDLKEDSGLVFVLLPGTTFSMGAQALGMQDPLFDPKATSDESPVHSVMLSAFFLSKYEMNQGQWKRLSGHNPSEFGAGGTWSTNWNAQGLEATLLEPAQQVTWFECNTLLQAFGLQLPSEAQWEYGARGGSTSVWWSGSKKESLLGACNLADTYAQSHGAEAWNVVETWLDDGYTAHAPVNTLRPNPFGLHHVHGNIWEWCADVYDQDYYERSPLKNPLNLSDDASPRVTRGGSFIHMADAARCASRFSLNPTISDRYIGLRPARSIAPGPAAGAGR